MEDFKHIYFVREYIINYASITALFLSNNDKNRFKIINKSEVRNNMILGCTFFSINSFQILLKMRKENPQNKIIVGGIGVFNSYNRILNYADYIYFGEAFIFNYDSILDKNNLKDKIKIQREIDYEKLPIIKIGIKNYYTLIETGCPYGCEYCYVSAVNKFTKISDFDFINRIKFIDKKIKKSHITFIGNEGLVKERNCDLFKLCCNNNYDNQSITLKNYLNNYSLYKNQKIVRFGIELPTENLRVEKLPQIKKITDEMIIDAIKNKYMNLMQFFYIWNYVGVKEEEYQNIFDVVKYKKDFLLRLNFTTLEIQPYTKIINKINEHIYQLLNSNNFQESKQIDKLRKISKIKIYPAKKNDEVLKFYLFTYTNRPITEKINNLIIDEILQNAKKMKIEKDVIFLNYNN